MRTSRAAFVTIIGVTASPCIADYVATGPYEAEVCSGFIVEKCSLEKLDAVKRNGQFYEINTDWNEVDDYKDGRCWISVGKGAFGFADKPPEFYQYDENRVLRQVNVDSYVTFECRQR